VQRLIKREIYLFLQEVKLYLILGTSRGIAYAKIKQKLSPSINFSNCNDSVELVKGKYK
jgi:hypothetical protein